MPSTLELAGVAKPEHVQFNSLMPIARGEGKPPYDAIYGGYLTVARMITQDGYKLLLFPKVKKVFLFDLKKDPEEMEDLAGKKRHNKRMKKLFARLLELQKETGDELDLKAIYPELLEK